VTLVNKIGNIYVGNFTPEFQLHGFVLTYNGKANTIMACWYKNNVRHGNYMYLNGTNMTILESGFHEEGKSTVDMKDDPVYKKFTRGDIFDYDNDEYEM